jgi:hypothetical protein
MSNDRDSNRTLYALLAIGLVLDLALLYLYYTPAPKRLMGDEFYYVGIATSRTFGRPGDPSPLWPPLYGDLVTRVFGLFGPQRLPMQALQIVMWLASGVMLHRIARRLAPAPIVANVAAGLFLLSPELMAFTHFFWAEIVHIFFVVAAVWLMVCHARSLATAAASGVLLGLALLTKLLLLPIAPLVPVAFALGTSGTWRTRLARAGLLGAAIVVTIAPTMLANRARYGAFMIADSSALTLWLGLVPPPDHRHAVAEFMASGPDMPTRNAVYREKAWSYVLQTGVLETLRRQLARQYFLLFSHRTWLTIQLPDGERARYRFGPPALALLVRTAADAAHAILLAAMALGVAALRPRTGGWWTVALAFLVYNLALYLPVNTNARYFAQGSKKPEEEKENADSSASS